MPVQDVIATNTHRADADPAGDAHREQLAALRARRAQAEAAIQDKLAPTPTEEIAAEQRAADDAEALAAALANGEKLGRTIEVVRTTIGNVIVKRCSSGRYRKFQDTGNFDSLSMEQLVRPNVVHPASEVFDRMIDEQPMIVFACGNAMSRMCGVRKDDVEKK